MAPVLPATEAPPAEAPVVKNEDGSIPVATPPAGGADENITPEDAAAELTRLRAENAELAKWKPLARKHERELTKLRGATPAPAADGSTPPAATGPSESDLKALRFEVALDRGLPKALAVRLQGTTREEIEEDADELLELPAFKPAPAPPRFQGGADGGAGGSIQPKAPNFGDQVRAAAGIRLQS